MIKIAEKNAAFLLLACIALVWFFTLPFDAIDIDSAQYAEISREMSDTGNFLHIRDNGRKYLDKPILTFWTISLSYKIFGVSNFAFRLPAVLISLLSLYSIYRIAMLLYGSSRKARLAALIYAFCPGLFAMLIDPKIDVYLTAYLIFTYHAFYLGRKKNPAWFFLMYLLMSMGVITKGPIAIVIPGISIGLDILVRRDWKLLFSMKIIPGFFILVSLPLMWSWLLYQEFSTYGPFFFMFLQSFGRFYRKMYDQKFDPFYFVNNFSFAFLLFIIPLIVYIVKLIRSRVKETGFLKFPGDIFRGLLSNRWKESDFTVPFWVFVTLFLISFSRYQRPQYIYWIIPAGALYTAKIVDSWFDESPGFYVWIVPGLAILFIIAYPFYSMGIGPVYFAIVCAAVILFFLLRKSYPQQILATLLSGATVYGIVIAYAYPELLKFQPSARVAQRIFEMERDERILYTFGVSGSKRSYGFYARRLTRPILDSKKFKEDLKKGPRLVLVAKDFLPFFNQFLGGGIRVETIESYQTYKVATPQPRFFSRAYRAAHPEKLFRDVLLVRVSAGG